MCTNITQINAVLSNVTHCTLIHVYQHYTDKCCVIKSDTLHTDTCVPTLHRKMLCYHMWHTAHWYMCTNITQINAVLSKMTHCTLIHVYQHYTEKCCVIVSDTLHTDTCVPTLHRKMLCYQNWHIGHWYMCTNITQKNAVLSHVTRCTLIHVYQLTKIKYQFLVNRTLHTLKINTTNT
jgi:acetylglutamate synthase